MASKPAGQKGSGDSVVAALCADEDDDLDFLGASSDSEVEARLLIVERRVQLML